jgi:hypothetical protein
MKKIVYSVIVFATCIVVACKKDRTCSCSSVITGTTTTTPQGGGTPTVNVTTANSSDDSKYSKVKKSELRRLYDCNSRTESSSSSYTTQVSVPSTTVIAGITFTIYNVVNADQKEENKTVITCDIK